LVFKRNGKKWIAPLTSAAQEQGMTDEKWLSNFSCSASAAETKRGAFLSENEIHTF
jgi:hypothetical protein